MNKFSDFFDIVLVFSHYILDRPFKRGIPILIALILIYWGSVRFWKFFITRRCHCGWPMIREHERDHTYCGAPYNPRRAYVITREVCINPFGHHFRIVDKEWRDFSAAKLRWDRVKRFFFGHV